MLVGKTVVVMVELMVDEKVERTAVPTVVMMALTMVALRAATLAEMMAVARVDRLVVMAVKSVVLTVSMRADLWVERKDMKKADERAALRAELLVDCLDTQLAGLLVDKLETKKVVSTALMRVGSSALWLVDLTAAMKVELTATQWGSQTAELMVVLRG